MTDCNQQQLLFPRCKGRRVEARFSGGDITSNGGVLLLSSAHPHQELFHLAAQRLKPG